MKAVPAGQVLAPLSIWSPHSLSCSEWDYIDRDVKSCGCGFRAGNCCGCGFRAGNCCGCGFRAMNCCGCGFRAVNCCG